MTVSLEVWRYLIGNTYLKELLRFSIGYFISGFFSLLTMVLVNKSLLPVQMGEYAYLKSILDLLVTVLGLNLYDSYLRFNSIKCNVGLVKKVQAILFLSLIVFMIVIYCLTNDFFCIIYSAALLFNERVYFFCSIIATKKLNIVRITQSATTLLIVAVFYLLEKRLTWDIVLVSYGIGYLLSSCFYFRKEKMEVMAGDELIPFKTVLRYCLPGVFLLIVNWVLNLSSQVFIKEAFSLEELADYAIAQRGLLAINLFSGLFLLFFPSIYFKEMDKKNYNLVFKFRKMISFVVLFFILLIALFSKELYFLMGASHYEGTVIYFRLLLVGEFIRIISNFYGLYLSLRLKVITSMFIWASGAILNVVLLSFFLKEYGVIFAAYSSICSSLLIFVLVYIFSYRKEKKYALFGI